MIVVGYFFLFLLKNICCGYSLEAPCRVMSTDNVNFSGELEKIIPKLLANTPP